MNAPYDPLQDPAADGFVDLSKQAWKDGASGLDAANASPVAPVSAMRKFINGLIGVAIAAALIASLLYGFYLWQRPKPTEPADDVKPAIAVNAAPATIVLPAPVKRSTPPAKNATVKIADYTINTPATAKIKAEIAPIEPLSPAEQDFETRLSNFERKIP